MTEVVKGSIPREDTPSIVLALLRAGADLENSLLNAFAVRVSGVSAAASEALDVARVPAMKSHYLVQALVTVSILRLKSSLFHVCNCCKTKVCALVSSLVPINLSPQNLTLNFL